MNKLRLHNEPQKGRLKSTPAPDGRELLTIDDLAQRLKMHPSTVRGLWRRRFIPGLVIGHRTLRFEYSAVLDALRQAGDPAVAVADK
jgi:hypothetical protein